MKSEFTLYGHQDDGGGLGPPVLTPYPGRALAARDMFVLHLDVQMGDHFDTSREPAIRADAFHAASRHLIAAGLVDASKVGLIGFSRNGYYVEYTLTQTHFGVYRLEEGW